MIKLDIQDYCHNCPNFEPECTKFYSGDGNCTTSISCENKGVCANIKLYIDKQIAAKERPDYMTTCINKWEDAACGQSRKKA